MPPITDYRSPKTLSYMAIIPLVIILGINVLFIIVGFGQIVMPNEIELDSGHQLSPWLALMGTLSLLEILMRVLAAIFFLIWLFRIFKNLAPTRIRNSENPPAWAIGYWFIPFVNLFKPYQVMQQAWRDTDPDADPNMGFVTSKDATNPLILIWWITYIVSNIASRFSNSKLVEEMSVSGFSLVVMIAGFIVAAAALMAIMIVQEITERQEKRAEKIFNTHALTTPPPPPTFSETA